MKIAKRILSIIVIILTVAFIHPVMAIIILLLAIIYRIDKEELIQELRKNEDK